MNPVSLGDMAQSYMLKRRNAILKQDITRLTEELATGKISDPKKILAGNFSYLTDLQRSMSVLQGYKVATSEMTHFATGIQGALERISDVNRDLSDTLLIAGTSSVGTFVSDTTAKARTSLDTFVGVLNSKISGRNLFSGTATDTAPLQSSEAILAELRLAVAGATTAADMMAAAQNWFDDPLGFSATVYQGSANDLAPFALSDTEVAMIDIRADDAELRNVLKSAAVAALADDPSISLSNQEQKSLFFLSATDILGSIDQVTSVRARVGFVEAQIDRIAARNASELTGMEFARNALLAADPYETATQLESVQFQLQSIYAVTVRMSQLSLVNYL